MDLPDTLKVQVNGFRITGQDVIPEPELQALLADKKGQLLTFKDLQEGADILTRYFRGKGYLVAHAYLPVQKINDGIVEYTVTVGTLDGFTINNHTSIHQGALERETNFLKKAYASQREIVTVFVEGRLSNFFYRVARLRVMLGLKLNIEMLWLPDEMFSQKGRLFRIFVGDPIPVSELQRYGGLREQAEFVR